MGTVLADDPVLITVGRRAPFLSLAKALQHQRMVVRVHDVERVLVHQLACRIAADLLARPVHIQELLAIVDVDGRGSRFRDCAKLTFALDQLVLGRLTLRDVDQRAFDEVFTIRALHQDHILEHPKLRPIPFSAQRLHVGEQAVFAQLAEIFFSLGPRKIEGVRIGGEYFLARVITEDLRERIVAIQHPAAQRAHVNAREVPVEQLAEALL